ncbi:MULTISPECIES: PIG-L deacetylase family protein [Streptomyces]|uniref:PIG-L family deacetylase n=1 Tax=Streptomyces griseosporeus TaxID=1910 RepID=A0ABV3KHE3_STRGS|nr:MULTISPECIES: PIG-L family deacetylase [Streptomyces]GHF42967.1 GlcNAc-PI de-N-acetylase [Streptomyces griseosporeus]
MRTVLVLAAHPDDELLGAGATFARHTAEGDAVHAVVLTEGASSRYREGLASELAKAAKGAAQVLGLASLRLWRLPDQRLDSLPLIDVVQRVEAVVDELRPDLVYTHFPGDVNADHGIVARAAWTACRPYVLPRLRRFAVFETPSSTEWAWATGKMFTPTLYVDVSGTLAVKLEAMRCYETEVRDHPHPRSLRALEERALYWGSRVGREAAEPLQVLREVY